MLRIINKDYREALPELGNVDTIFADPPDNIGLKYANFSDSLEVEHYINFLDELICLSTNYALTTYISFNAKWMTEVGALLGVHKQFSKVGPLEIRWLIQGFTFGQHRNTDYGNNFRPIIRIRKEHAPLFPDKVRVESDRMKQGDKRANPAGRVPGDVWFSDFLEYARVTGNSRQRRNWHPTQLHEGLVEDCLLMSTPTNGVVFDPFMGTGTTLRVCKACELDCITTDVSEEYCVKVAEEHGMTRKGVEWL